MDQTHANILNFSSLFHLSIGKTPKIPKVEKVGMQDWEWLIAGLGVILSFLIGCSSAKTSTSFMVQGQITDVSVVEYARDRLTAWGEKSSKDRVLGVGGPIVLSSLSAASAGTALGGGSAGAVAVVVNVMSWVAQLFGIVDPPARLSAYNRGVRMLRTAIGNYVEAVGKSGIQFVPNDRLTSAGATLLKRITTAENAVDVQLEGVLPSQEEMKALLAQ